MMVLVHSELLRLVGHCTFVSDITIEVHGTSIESKVASVVSESETAASVEINKSWPNTPMATLSFRPCLHA